MLTNGCDHHTGTLLRGFFCQDAGHIPGIDFVQVANRLVKKNEIERLAKRTDQSHALLLTEGHLPYFDIHLIADTKFMEQLLDFFLLNPVSEFFSSTFSMAVSSVKRRKS